MLVGSPDLPPHLQELAGEVMTASDAAGLVLQLRNISRIQEQQWNAPGDATINLARSQCPPPRRRLTQPRVEYITLAILTRFERWRSRGWLHSATSALCPQLCARVSLHKALRA